MLDLGGDTSRATPAYLLDKEANLGDGEDARLMTPMGWDFIRRTWSIFGIDDDDTRGWDTIVGKHVYIILPPGATNAGEILGMEVPPCDSDHERLSERQFMYADWVAHWKDKKVFPEHLEYKPF